MRSEKKCAPQGQSEKMSVSGKYVLGMLAHLHHLLVAKKNIIVQRYHVTIYNAQQFQRQEKTMFHEC